MQPSNFGGRKRCVKGRESSKRPIRRLGGLAPQACLRASTSRLPAQLAALSEVCRRRAAGNGSNAVKAAIGHARPSRGRIARPLGLAWQLDRGVAASGAQHRDRAARRRLDQHFQLGGRAGPRSIDRAVDVRARPAAGNARPSRPARPGPASRGGRAAAGAERKDVNLREADFLGTR